MLVGAVWALGLGCAKEETEPRGQLMLALTTDMAPPKDFDRVEVELLTFGSVEFKNQYTLGKGKLKLPATLGIAAGKQPDQPVTIRVIGRLGREARYLREIVTTVPKDRIATLSVNIEWLCLEHAEETTESEVESTCAAGKTCVAGECVSSELDSSTFADYQPQDIFGGGDGTGNGSCFDTVGCFAEGEEVAVDVDDCSIDAVAASDLSIALTREPGTEGICGPQACLIPLDAGAPGGWVTEGSRILLPAAVCERLQSQDVLGVAVTTACDAKTPGLPTCGDWSSVTTEPGSTNGKAPDGFELPTAGGGGEAGQDDHAGEAGEAGEAPGDGGTASGGRNQGGTASGGTEPTGGSLERGGAGNAGEAVGVGGDAAGGSSYGGGGAATVGGTSSFGGDSPVGGASPIGGVTSFGGNPSMGGASTGGVGEGGEPPVVSELPELCARATENWHLDQHQEIGTRATLNHSMDFVAFGTVAYDTDVPRGAFRFDGATQLGVADNPQLDLGTDDLALSAWVKIPASSEISRRIISHGAHGNLNSGYALMEWCAGWGTVPCGGVAFLLGLDSVGEWLVGTCEPMDDGQWHHYVVNVRRDSEIEFFVDGSLLAAPCSGTASSAAWSGDVPGRIDHLADTNIDTPCPFCFGGACQQNGVCTGNSETESNTIVEPFTGSVDEVAVFREPLSAQDVSALYNEGQAPALCGRALTCTDPEPGGCLWGPWTLDGTSVSWLEEPTYQQASFQLESAGTTGCGVDCVLDCSRGHHDLSGVTGLHFTGEILPAGASFEVAVEASNGTRGCVYVMTALEGRAVYELDLSVGAYCWDDGTTAFSWSEVQQINFKTPWDTASSLQMTISAPEFIRG